MRALPVGGSPQRAIYVRDVHGVDLAREPRSTPRSAERAANQPHIPCTPPPGGVEDEQMKSRGSGVEEKLSTTASVAVASEKSLPMGAS